MNALRFLLLIVVSLSACIDPSKAQLPDRREAQTVLDQMLGRTTPSGIIPTPALEGPIDPAKYSVGPSDMLTVSVWGPVSFSVTLTVTPDGNLIVPTVGVLNVAGRTLDEVKRSVRQSVSSKYTVGEITTTLIRARSFLVNVTGNILNPGQFEMTPADRVEKAIVDASRVFLPSATVTVQATTDKEARPPIQQSIYNDPSLNQVMEIFGKISTRNIKVFRRNDTLRVDIPKFYATRDDRHNPFLLDGDVIFVPRKVEGRNFLGVYGAVNTPGVYEYVESDSLSDALLIAGGPTPDADLRSVRVLRMNDRGDPMEEMVVDRSTGLANVKLRTGDRVVVGQTPSEIRDFRVNVVGEVKSPGYYPVSNGKTKLSIVIKDAGGFTANALLSGAVVLRKAERDELREYVGPDIDFARHMRSHNFSMSDSVYYFSTLKAGRYSVSVDFSRVFEREVSSDDIVLMDGDIVYVPSKLEGVLVQGQVSRPGYLPYLSGAAIQQYIDKAGGYSEYADQGEVRIIKKSTLDWVEPGETSLDPGDQIWIPKKPRRDARYYLEIVRDIASVVAAVGTTIILAIQVTR